MDGWVGGWMHLQSHQDEAVLDAVSILKRPLRADLRSMRRAIATHLDSPTPSGLPGRKKQRKNLRRKRAGAADQPTKELGGGGNTFPAGRIQDASSTWWAGRTSPLSIFGFSREKSSLYSSNKGRDMTCSSTKAEEEETSDLVMTGSRLIKRATFENGKDEAQNAL